MGILARRTSEHGEVGRPSQGSGITGSDVHGAAFTGAVVGFDSLGLLTPPELGPEVTSAVSDDPRPRRRDDRYYRRRVGWRAGRGGLVIAMFRQPLILRADKNLAPAGEYALASAEVHLADEPARRRLATIPIDPAATDPAPADASGGDTNPADEALALLPEAARVALVTQVPTPTVYDADAISYDSGARYVVSAVRVARGRAAVLVGTLHAGESSWQVEHVTYSLHPPTSLTSARPSRRDGLLEGRSR